MYWYFERNGCIKKRHSDHRSNEALKSLDYSLHFVRNDDIKKRSPFEKFQRDFFFTSYALLEQSFP